MADRLIDLSEPCGADTPGFTVTLQEKMPVYCGYECRAYDLAIRSHHGTYFETSSHVFREGRDTDAVSLDRLILPGVCLDVRGAGRRVGAADLERIAGDLPFPAGAGLLLRAAAEPGEPHRYFTRDAAEWMAGRKVALMGSDTPRYDNGFENPTGFFVDLFRAEIPIVANIGNLDRLPLSGFTLIVLPLAVAGVCTVPCRVVAAVGGLPG
jgi:kynurenine formamidase